MSPASPPVDETKSPDRRASLSREMGELLIELSIGVHRYAMYPPGHPSLGPAAENIVARLGRYFFDEESLSIGVAHEQLVIEGVATDSGHPVLSDLARRLYDHQLGALSFERGVRAAEVEDFLEALARDPESDGALGRAEEGDRPGWEKIAIHPIGYDQLRIEGGPEDARDEPARAALLWLGLAQAAMASDRSVAPDEVPGTRVLADTIREHDRETAYDQVIVGYLLQLTEELKEGGGEEASRIRERVSGLIRELDDETLGRLVEMGGDRSRVRDFVLNANEGLAVDAVLKLLTAASRASGQTISNSLTRMLTKLSMHAREGARHVRDQAETALRDHVDRLIDDWELEDPNPGEYTRILDAMSRAAPVLREGSPGADGNGEGIVSGAHRLLQMAVEVDSFGPSVRSAVSELVSRGELPFVLGLVDGAPPESEVASRIRGHLTSPEQVRRLLSGDDVDERSLEAVIERVGSAAVDPLLDALIESEARAVRRKVFDVLSRMEEGVTEAISARLGDSRWYVVRNMLALVQRVGRAPEDFDPMEYVDHPDHRVRREAFPLALARPSSRERALAAGLSDGDDRLVRMSLLELREGLPDILLPTLVNRVIRGEHPAELRAMAIRTLQGIRSPLARDSLVEVAGAGKTLLRRPKVAEPTPPVVAAVGVLASTWSDDPRARPLLDAARRSKDDRIREAAESADEDDR